MGLGGSLAKIKKERKSMKAIPIKDYTKFNNLYLRYREICNEFYKLSEKCPYLQRDKRCEITTDSCVLTLCPIVFP